MSTTPTTSTPTALAADMTQLIEQVVRKVLAEVLAEQSTTTAAPSAVIPASDSERKATAAAFKTANNLK